MLSINAKNIDEFIAGSPKNTQELLKKMRSIIQKAAPGTEEAISYGIPTYKLNGRNLVHFSGYKEHIGFYPGAAGIESFKEELSKYKTSKGTVQFPLDKPLPVGLITQIVKFRIAQEKEKEVRKSESGKVRKKK
jgi:uncharacterized protein YdhG (YjbR/CyaY superfamily)